MSSNIFLIIALITTGIFVIQSYYKKEKCGKI